ncbi:MAG: XdhC family protein [Chloroflexota bacterium]
MFYQTLARLEADQEPAALCTVVRTQGSTPRHAASKMIVYPDGRIEGTIGGGEVENRVIAEALVALKDGQPRLLSYSMADPTRGDPGVCGGQVEVFVEPLLPRPVLVVIGAGHVGKAVVHLAKWLGFQVVVSDDRAELCTPQGVPEADAYYACAMAELPDRMPITPQTCFVLATRGSDVDVAGLPALLQTPAAYIGVIGSRRRWAFTRQKLLEAGVPDEKLALVHSPVGLDIRAETPQEIAVSILAQVVALRANAV